MAVTLSIKNVPDELVSRLRRRALQNHRSLQGELLTILEQSLEEADFMTPQQVVNIVRQWELRTPSESTTMIRADRNAR